MKKIFLPFLILGTIFLTPLEAKINPLTSNIEGITEQKVVSIFDNFSYQLDDNTSWKIINTKNNSVYKTGLGSISDIKFTEPAIYEIEIQETLSNNECAHNHFPSKISLQVSPIKMNFDFSTLKFNNEIIGGQSQDGNFLSVDVIFSSLTNESIEFTSGELTTAGVGVNIEGKLVNEKTTLTPGLNHLTYKLTGTATSQTYIMFNFIDINNQVTSYYLPTKIK